MAQEQSKTQPRPNPRYEGSIVQKIDNALMKGGTYDEIAKACGEPIGKVKACVRARIKSGKWRLVENDDRVQMEAAEQPEATTGGKRAPRRKKEAGPEPEPETPEPATA